MQYAKLLIKYETTINSCRNLIVFNIFTLNCLIISRKNVTLRSVNCLLISKIGKGVCPLFQFWRLMLAA